MSKQRLILLFDGTWNDPDDRTNVFRLAQHIKGSDGDIRQKFFYDPGVGTAGFEAIRGGLFAYGLTKNLLQGYEWLAKSYAEGDEIWLFGFSRGAYTARSLAGLIRKCGLLRIVTQPLLDKAEEMYRDKNLGPDDAECVKFRSLYSRAETRVHFIGVWDTVGALGIPVAVLSRDKYSWHDTQLSGIVDHAYHALALDEHRADYDVALWTSSDGRQKPQNIEVEQRWFIGAHSNVGGGYDNDPLADIPLKWMMQKAEGAGLKLDQFNLPAEAWKRPLTDSFKQFFKGIYAFWKRVISPGDGRHYRSYSGAKGSERAVNISVDETVWQRWEETGLNYRPRTLTDAGQTPPANQTPAR